MSPSYFVMLMLWAVMAFGIGRNAPMRALVVGTVANLVVMLMLYYVKVVAHSETGNALADGLDFLFTFVIPDAIILLVMWATAAATALER